MTSGLLPLQSPIFNLREVCKHLLLLEDHLNNPRKRCPDCIRKHFLTAEAFLEESVSLGDSDELELRGELASQASDYAAQLHELGDLWNSGGDPCEVAQGLRSIRKELLPFCFLLPGGARTAREGAPMAHYVASAHRALSAACNHPRRASTQPYVEITVPEIMGELVYQLAYRAAVERREYPLEFGDLLTGIWMGMDRYADSPAGADPFYRFGFSAELLELLLNTTARESPELSPWVEKVSLPVTQALWSRAFPG